MAYVVTSSLATVAVMARNYGTAFADMVDALKSAARKGDKLEDIRKAWIIGRIAAELPGDDQAAMVAAEARLTAPNAKTDAIVNRARSACSYAFKQAGLTDNVKGAGRKARMPGDTAKPAAAMVKLEEVAKTAAVAAIVPDVAVASLAPKDASRREELALARRLSTLLKGASNRLPRSEWRVIVDLLSAIQGDADVKIAA